MKKNEKIFIWAAKKFSEDFPKTKVKPTQLADLLGVSKATISFWTSARYSPGKDKYELCRSVFKSIGLDFDSYLLEPGSAEAIEEAIYKRENALNPKGLTAKQTGVSFFWPIIGRAAGGPWIEALETSEYTSFAEDYMTVSQEFKDPNGYALRVVGDSMEPVLPDGTQIAVSPNRPAQNGDKAVVFIRSEVSNQAEVCVKRFFYHGAKNEQVRLVSYNPAYKDIVLPLERILKAHKVVEWHGRG